MHAATFSAAEKCPAAQLVHALPSMYVPGLHVPQYPLNAPPQPLRCAPLGHPTLAQLTHCTWSVVFEKVSGGQARQRDGDGSLALNSKVPGRQGSRTAGNAKPVPQYVPSGHLRGSFVPPGQKKPAVQRPEHSACVWLPALPKRVAGHGWHSACPVSFWNEPAGHVNRYPSKQRLPGGQAVQRATLPLVSPYWPSGQLMVQLAAPALLNVPHGQGVLVLSPSVHAEPAGQMVQVVRVLRSPPLVNEPAAHTLQDARLPVLNLLSAPHGAPALLPSHS